MEIWALRLQGKSKAEIGRTLGITRQAVYDAEGIMLNKVDLALRHAAESNMINTLLVDSKKGILLGHSPHTKQNVIVTFSKANGIQTWHHQQPNCNACSFVERCRDGLVTEAEERGIKLVEEGSQLPPSELASMIFESLLQGELIESS